MESVLAVRKDGQSLASPNIFSSARNLRVRPTPKTMQSLTDRIRFLEHNLSQNKALTDEHGEFLRTRLAEVRDMKALMRAEEEQQRNKDEKLATKRAAVSQYFGKAPHTRVANQDDGECFATSTDQVLRNAIEENPSLDAFLPPLRIEKWTPTDSMCRLESGFSRFTEAESLRRQQAMRSTSATLGLVPRKHYRLQQSRSASHLRGTTVTSFKFSEREQVVPHPAEYGSITEISRSEQRQQILFGATARTMLSTQPMKSHAEAFRQKPSGDGVKFIQMACGSFAEGDVQTGGRSSELHRKGTLDVSRTSLRWGDLHETVGL